MDTEGQIARITESKEKRAMMMYQKVILFICIVILGFLGFMAYSGYKGGSIVQDYDQDIQQRLVEELMIDLLRIDQSKNNSLTHKRNKRDLDTQISVRNENQNVDISVKIKDAEKSLMWPSKTRQDQELFHKNKFSALEKIVPAPMAVALLSQIVLVSASYKRDFSLECPKEGCKHLDYPDSFKSTLLQMSFSAYDAFNKAHNNMDQISMLMQGVPTEITNAVTTLIQGTDEEVDKLLPNYIQNIREIATGAITRASSTVDAFDEVKVILEEIIAGGQSKQHLSQQEIEELTIKIETQKAWETFYENEKKNLKADTKELKAALTMAQKDFDKAMDNLPTGWTKIGMNLVETLTDGLGVTATGLAQGLAGSLVPLSLIGTGLGTFKEAAGIYNQFGDPGRSPISEAVQNMTVPKCNKYGVNSTKTERIKMERTDAAEFIAALTDLIRTEDIMKQFTLNIFEERNATGKTVKTLKSNAAESINFLKISVEGPKTRVSSNQIPPYLSSDFQIFYTNIISLAENMKEAKSQEEVDNLDGQVKELSDTCGCFATWSKQVLQLPPMEKPSPFDKRTRTRRGAGRKAQGGGRRDAQLLGQTDGGSYGDGAHLKTDDKSKGLSASQVHAENAQFKVDTYQAELDRAQKRYDIKAEQLLKTNLKLRETINKLQDFDASKATLGEIISILQEALITLNQLRTKWLEILEFFQQIESIVHVSLVPALKKVAKHVEFGAELGKVSNILKQQMYGYIQDAMSNGYLVRRMSEVYVSISTEFILPPVRELGEMLVEKDEKKINSRKISISRKAEDANKSIEQKIKKEMEIFGRITGDRKKEIESTFRPILSSVSPARKSEIKAIVQQGEKYLPAAIGNPWA